MYKKNEILKIINSASSEMDLEEILNHLLWLMNETNDFSSMLFIRIVGLMKYVNI